MTCKRLCLFVVGVSSFLMAGCDSTRLSQFGTFAAAGIAYVTAFHTFTADAGSAYIATDSATLIVARNQLSAEQLNASKIAFRSNAVRQDKQSKEYITNLQKLDVHASLLGAYFAAIIQLTDGKASDSTVTSVNSLADAINAFNPEIENVKFGDKNVKDYLGSIVPLVVDHFAVKRLNEDLNRNAKIIDRALSLQDAAVAAISDQMKSALAASLEVRESTDVLNPYLTPGQLPDTWPSSRERFIRADVTLASADSAKAAISSLHQAFRDLLANKSAAVDFGTVLSDIGQMAGYAAAVKANH